MLLSWASILIFMEKKRVFNNSSESLMTLWDEWELRIVVLSSLLLQIILTGLGILRKYHKSNWFEAGLLWFAYSIADDVAIAALGILSCSQSSSATKSLDPDYQMSALWAPFLLLHLGGPDTITAYVLEDNELWPRHLVKLVLKAGLAFYVIFSSLKSTLLIFVAIPILIAGLIKYVERILVLRSASIQQLKNSMLSHPDPGANYAKLMKYYTLKEMEGYNLEFKTIQLPKYNVMPSISSTNKFARHMAAVNVAYDFFLTFNRLLADLILSYEDLQNSPSFFEKISSDDAFNLIEIELEFMYDLLFTKATLVYSTWGVILRTITTSLSIAALAVFSIIDRQAYSRTNVAISFFLLVGAIGLEICAVIIMLYSNWTVLWLSKKCDKLVNVFSNFKALNRERRRSNSVAQYNLISYCVKDQLLLAKFFNISCACKLGKYMRVESLEPVDAYLKNLIFEQILQKFKIIDSDDKTHKKLYKSRGCFVLMNHGCLNDNSLEELHWSVDAAEFDQSILLWHIATDLCYYDDENSPRSENSVPLSDQCRQLIKASKSLSNYMMHILVKLPLMLPDGIGQIRFQDTEAEAIKFIRGSKSTSNESVCAEILRVNTRIEPSLVKGDRLSKSELFNACRIAKQLQSLQHEKGWEVEKKWEMISNVWVEMVLYAASHCRWNHHAQQLGGGGELLTHVWLLMAHFGLTDKLQQHHPRTVMTLS